MTIVSNSDISTAQKCERMFYYSRVMRKQPKSFPVWIERGSFGHTMMEYGFKSLLDGATVTEAQQAASVPLMQLMESEHPDKAEMMKVYRHVCSFIDYTQQPNVAWKPVAMEEVGMWDVSEDLRYAFTPDLVIEFTQGKSKGQRAVLDYKFRGQYLNETQVKMAQQIPKYIAYRNMMKNEKIRHGAYVQLNTRASADAKGHQLFLISWIIPSKQRLARIVYENELWLQRVSDLSKKEPDEFLRTVNDDTCGRCWFQQVCDAEFEGKPIDKILERDYVENEYGY